MAKKKFKSFVTAGVLAASVIQITPVYAVTLSGTGPGVDGYITDEQYAAQVEKQEAEVAKYESKSTNTRLDMFRGQLKTDDPNREIHTELNDHTRQFSRYTDDEGIPFTGMYKSVKGNGNGYLWMVLDKDGFLQRDLNKPQFAWFDGMYCADFMDASGLSFNQADGKYYLGDEFTKDGALLTYIVRNDWVKFGDIWYRSHEDGVAYRNEWFKNTDGKWYYFDDKCKMVTSKLVDGYYIGADGVWVG